MAVVIAITNGTVPMCLLGSFLIYKEKMTILQVVGSLICLAGILTMSLPLAFMPNNKTDDFEVNENSSKALKLMLIDSAIAMLMLSARMNMAKYCTRILSSLTFLKYNLLADFICALFVVLLSVFGVINIPFSSYIDKDTL